MKIETSVSAKLVLSEIEGLDPITVHMEDLEPGRGSITVRCHSQVWSGSWGAMGKDRKVAQFVTSCGADYLMGCFSPQLRATRFSSDELIKMAQRCVIDRRRNRNGSEWNWMDEFDKREARSLFNRIHDLHGITDGECWQQSDLLTKLFGNEWWHKADECQEPNPDWSYLERIVEAVKAGIKQMEGVAA